MSTRFGSLGTQYFDNSGNVLSGGKIHFYESGTTTDKDTYSDINLTIPNTNPVVLDAYGRQGNIFFDGVAKAVLLTSADVILATCDPVGALDGEGQFEEWIPSVNYPVDSIVLGSNGVFYIGTDFPNLGNDPTTSPLFWDVFIDGILAGQTVVAAKSVAVGNATTGLAGVAIANGRMVIGDTTNGIAALNTTTKGTLAVGNGTTTTTLAVGTNGHVLTADSGEASGAKWAAAPSAGLTPITTVTPTAAANVDFLSAFTSGYDNYRVILEGITVSGSNGTLRLRLANAGTVDSGSNYITAPSTAAAYIDICDIEPTGTTGATITLEICNANNATTLKSVSAIGMSQNTTPTTNYQAVNQVNAYIGAAVSGGRLYFDGGQDFGATGIVRIFGYAN